MIVVTVARKPLAASNVASNVLTHGVGAVNIDGCRVSAPGEVIESHVQGKAAANSRHTLRASWQGIEENYQTPGQKLGRWPSNLVLEHKPGCVRVGNRKVRGAGFDSHRPPRSTGSVFGAQRDTGPAMSRTDADGMEEVAAWECAPGCPIAGLDQQSGESKSSGFGGRVVVKRRTGAEREGNTTPRFGAESRGEGSVMSSYDDAGGASRFFKQVGGKP